MRNIHDYDYLERADYTWSEDSVRFVNTPTQTARQTFFYVQEAGYFRTSPPYFTERANLNSFLVVYTLSGKGSLSYQGETYDLLPESAFYIHCLEHHEYTCVPGQEWEFLWFHFNGPSALGYYKEFAKNGFHIINHTDSFFMESTMQRILSITRNKDLHAEIMVSGLIAELLTELLIQNSSTNRSPESMPEYLKGILKEMEKRFQEPLTLDLLSKEFSISKYHFSREFKRFMGTSPNEYLILIRLNHAKELLKYSRMTVEEIAYSCGFNNVSHFIHIFKDREKNTPLKFRKEWENI
ncbi:MAG: AraC family transcriptional regulator [Eubacteriales bacterium]|nr:AraC family transcriptional regulator [Eubacteriales bacterium]